MARLYADEQFPRIVVKLLRALGHDILTVQEAGKANQRIPDEEVLAFAIADNRTILTINRSDFKRLANQIHEAITNTADLTNILIRINRPSK